MILSEWVSERERYIGERNNNNKNLNAEITITKIIRLDIYQVRGKRRSSAYVNEGIDVDEFPSPHEIFYSCCIKTTHMLSTTAIFSSIYPFLKNIFCYLCTYTKKRREILSFAFKFNATKFSVELEEILQKNISLSVSFSSSSQKKNK